MSSPSPDGYFPVILASAAAQVLEGNSLWTDILYNASGPVVVGMLLAALVSGKLILPRELEAARQRYDDLVTTSAENITRARQERDEYKEIAFKLARIGEAATTVAEGTRR